MENNKCLYCNNHLKEIDFKNRAKIFFIFTIFIVSMGIWMFGHNIIDYIIFFIGSFISYKLYKKGSIPTCINKDCIGCFK